MKNTIEFFEKGSIEVLCAKSNHNFPLHSHESFCFGIVEDGEVSFTIKDETKLLRKGMCFIIPSNTGVKIQTESSYCYTTICIKDEWKRRLSALSYTTYYLEWVEPNKVHKLNDELFAGGAEEEFIYGLLDLMEPAIGGYQKDKQRENEIISQAKQYMEAHMHDKFSLSRLAESIPVSKYYLIRLFKEQMGVTPNQYYIQTKMRYIKKEVIAEESPIDIALEFSFNDQSHLCNTFKKQMGITLSDYKKNFNSIEE